jgi:hypothetical protein
MAAVSEAQRNFGFDAVRVFFTSIFNAYFLFVFVLVNVHFIKLPLKSLYSPEEKPS